MTTELFELSLTNGPARSLHERGEGSLAHALPWSSLDPSSYPPELVAEARSGWTRQAFTEHCSALAMTRLVDLLGQIRAPLDLWSLSASFPPQEIIHTELCARVAMALGGGAPLRFDPATLRPPPEGSLTPLQRACDIVVRVCAVDEILSHAVMKVRLRLASHPVTRAVLGRIVRDEAMHGRFAELFLDWTAPDLDKAERARLGRLAAAALDEIRAGLDALADAPEVHAPEHLHVLGWTSLEVYRETALRAIERDIVPLLSRYGLSR